MSAKIQISVRLEEEDLERVEKLAKRFTEESNFKIDKSNVLRRAVFEFLEKNEQKA